jgi:hypothetical protein
MSLTRSHRSRLVTEGGSLCLPAFPFSHSRLMLKFREESPPAPHTDDSYAVFVAVLPETHFMRSDQVAGRSPENE